MFRYLGPVQIRGQEFSYDFIHKTQSVGPVRNAPELDNRLYAGTTFGGGVELTPSRLSLVPEVRFTRWVSPNLEGDFLMLHQPQVEILLGFVF